MIIETKNDIPDIPAPEAEPPLTPQEKRRKRLKKSNPAVGGIGCFGVMMWGLATLGISHKIGVLGFIIGICAVPLLALLHRKTDKFKWLLQTARGISIALIAAAILMPSVCLHFEHMPLLFRLKRYVYTEGVRKPDLTDTLMPASLPANHDDYYFRTEPSMIAQDYCPFAYLAYHTDGATLRAYEQSLTGNPHLTRRENPKYTEDDLEGLDLTDDAINAGYLPMFVYRYVKEQGGICDDLTHAVIYQGDNSGTWHCGSGALINYETGLLIVWL